MDSYKIITTASESIYKEKGSKFIAKVFAVETEEQFKEILKTVKKEYYDARHHCYAWRIHPEKEQYRSNDDGEPSGSAGKPILNQLYSFELFNVCVIVIRYFGGTKLGVSGLINAYKTVSRDALSKAGIVTKFITSNYELEFDYPLLNDMMRIIKEENLEILDQNFEMSCIIKIAIKKNEEKKLISKLSKFHKLKLKPLKTVE